MEKLNIKISVANRLYPMNVDSQEEKVIRISASKINKMLKSFKEKYSVRDNQDLLAMCALQLSVQLEKLEIVHEGEHAKNIKSLINLKKSISEVI